MLIKFHPTLSFCLATPDYVSTCCHDGCCLATVGNHGLTEPEVCHVDLSHKQFTCRDMPARTHTEEKRVYVKIVSFWTLMCRNPNKHRAVSEVALHQWCHCCHGNHWVGIVFFFFSTAENSSFLSSFFAHLFSLPLLFPGYVSLSLLLCFSVIKLTCRKANGQRRPCKYGHTRT